MGLRRQRAWNVDWAGDLEPDHHRGATSGCVLDDQLVAHRLEQALGHCQPEPDALTPRRVAEPLERLKYGVRASPRGCQAHDR